MNAVVREEFHGSCVADMQVVLGRQLLNNGINLSGKSWILGNSWEGCLWVFYQTN
jgi:hypothetical protein